MGEEKEEQMISIGRLNILLIFAGTLKSTNDSRHLCSPPSPLPHQWTLAGLTLGLSMAKQVSIVDPESSWFCLSPAA